MPRSHPPTLITLATRTLREECRLEKGDSVLVAVSGGPDSMALFDVLARVRPKLGFELAAHGVDHGLRSEAERELDLAERHAGHLGVPFARTRVDVAPGGNLQARARSARYAALEAAQRAVGATLLATAHHADDRAETVLLRLLRGAGPRGLGVLAPRAETRIRPLIRARRSDVLLHLERHAVPFATDPSNRDPRYLRTRVRGELVPLLSELSPGIVGHLNALADALLDEDGAGARAIDVTMGVELRDGAPKLALGRAQRALLARARSFGQGRAVVALGGGWEARVDPKTGTTTVIRSTR